MTKKIPERSFYPIYGYMLEELNLGGSELLVYAILSAFSKGESSFYGSMDYLARYSGLSKSTVKRALNSLLIKKLIEKSCVDGFPTYRITNPKKDIHPDTTTSPTSTNCPKRNWKEEIPTPWRLKREDATLYDFIGDEGRPVHEFYEITSNGIIKMTPEQFYYLICLVGEDKVMDYVKRIEAKVLCGEFDYHPDYKLIKKWILEDILV